MHHDFLLVNGDTVFDGSILVEVINSEPAPITVCVGQKSAYDADDMKVQLDTKGWVKHVSKTLPVDQIDAESIGLIFFRPNEPQMFCDAVENARRNQAKFRSWYFTIIDALARKQMVNVCPVQGPLV